MLTYCRLHGGPFSWQRGRAETACRKGYHCTSKTELALAERRVSFETGRVENLNINMPQPNQMNWTSSHCLYTTFNYTDHINSSRREDNSFLSRYSPEPTECASLKPWLRHPLPPLPLWPASSPRKRPPTTFPKASRFRSKTHRIPSSTTAS